jgi:Amt family ammonium transporter
MIRIDMKSARSAAVAAALLAVTALPALAQETPAPAPVMEKGDVTWMMLSSILVLFMALPGLALFYGGMVRSKNMLSVLMQSAMITSVMMVIWVVYGYSFAFGGSESPFFGGFAKLFLSGVTVESTAATFTPGVVIPEYLFIVFQMTFAAITPVLIIGAFAERAKFSAILLFSVLWATFVYFPVAHMVWDPNGYLFKMGAIDFAGGTVVHINSGIAALIGCIMIGQRRGYGKDMMAPHSLPLVFIGASILWVGWFGFNVGSNLEANAGATLAMLNTFLAPAGAVMAWGVVEYFHRGKASMLGAASGMITGLVAITPACGTVGPVGAIVLGALASVVSYYFVAGVKMKLKYDDSLDVFGIHGVGGIVGALGTAVFSAAAFGGIKGDDYSIGGQFVIQLTAVLITIVWCAIVSVILFKLVDMIIGLRVKPEVETQGLDQPTHGEVAYHS